MSGSDPHRAQETSTSFTSLSDLEQVSGNHVIQTDAEGVITAVSPGVKEEFQWAADDMIGRRLTDFIEPEDRQRTQDILIDAIPGLTASIGFHLMNRRMTTIPVRARVTALRDNGVILIAFHEEVLRGTDHSLVSHEETHEPAPADVLVTPQQDSLDSLLMRAFSVFTPTKISIPSVKARSRWRIFSGIGSTIILLTILSLVGWDLLHSTTTDGTGLTLAGPLTATLITVSVLLSLPRTRPWNKASMAVGGIATVASVIALAAHVLIEQTTLETSNIGVIGSVLTSELEGVLLILLSLAAWTLGTSNVRWMLTGGAAQLAGWMLIVPVGLLYAYHHAGNVFPWFFDDHSMTLTATLLVIGLLLVLGAARPERPPISSPFMGKGFGTVPVAVAISLIVPAVLMNALFRPVGAGASGEAVAVTLLVSISTMFIAMMLLESRRLISEQRQQEALQEQARQYRLYTDNMADALLYVREGFIEWMSRSSDRVLGWGIKDGVGKRLIDQVHPADRNAVTDALEARNSDDVTVIVARMENGSQEYMWTQQTVRDYVESDGTVNGSIIVLRDITEQRNAEEQARNASIVLEHRAKHDTLTGLLNRSEALNVLGALTAVASTQHPVTILWADLDNFRHINDGISHESGDDILIQIATLIDANIPFSGLTARAGGDEFLVILPGASTEDGLAIAQNLLDKARGAEFGSEGFVIPIGLSIGVATAASPMTASALISNADTALTRAKSQARGTATSFTDEMQQDIAERIRTAQALKEGIERGEFHAWGQPIVLLSTGKVVGYEALARWIPSDGSDPVPAFKWVDVAEAHGLMTAIGEIVIEDAIAAAAGLPEEVYVTVNASGRQLLQPGFTQHLLDHVIRNGITPSRVIVEVTEATLIDPLAAKTINAVLHEISNSGIRVYLDDFGTGYSAISHLSNFPVSGLKLDQSFTRGLSDDHGTAEYALVEGLASLAQSLDLARVAEGIETEEQAKAVEESGWNCGQGWLYGRPAPFPSPTRLMVFPEGQEPPLPPMPEPADREPDDPDSV